MSEPIGEVIDKIPIAEVIEMKEFFSLHVVKSLPATEFKAYWEITFECKERGEDGLWRTPFGQLLPDKLYKVYKEKINK